MKDIFTLSVVGVSIICVAAVGILAGWYHFHPQEANAPLTPANFTAAVSKGNYLAFQLGTDQNRSLYVLGIYSAGDNLSIESRVSLHLLSSDFTTQEGQWTDATIRETIATSNDSEGDYYLGFQATNDSGVITLPMMNAHSPNVALSRSLIISSPTSSQIFDIDLPNHQAYSFGPVLSGNKIVYAWQPVSSVILRTG